jgi:hypothetical protein
MYKNRKREDKRENNMKRLILVRWSMKEGPKNVIQFPPEAYFPPKEILLKLWARHEITQDSNFVVLQDTIQTHKHYYCSLLTTHPQKNQPFLIILDLEPESNILIFREILETIKDDLLNNLNSSNFSHVLSETYRIIKTQSEMDENQLFYRLFEDKARLEILKILRRGVISKQRLKELIQQRWGRENINLDLLITPLIRLGLIKIKDVPGAKECLFLVKDVFCSRLPSKNEVNQSILSKLNQIIEIEGILIEDSIQPLMKLMQQPGIKELCALLAEDVQEGMSFEVALTVVKHNNKYLDQLEKFHIIHIEDNKMIYLLTELDFLIFQPIYLPQILIDRYLAEEISFDQMLAHLQLLKFTSIY